MVKELLPLLAVTVSLVISTEALWPWAMPYASLAINHDRQNHHGRQWPASLPRPSPPIYNDHFAPYEQERSYDDSLSHDDHKGHENTPRVFSVGPAANMKYNQDPSAWEHYTMMKSGPGYDNIEGHGGSGSLAWKHFTLNDLPDHWKKRRRTFAAGDRHKSLRPLAVKFFNPQKPLFADGGRQILLWPEAITVLTSMSRLRPGQYGHSMNDIGRQNHHGRQWLPSLPRPSPPIYNDRHSHHGRQWPSSLPRPSPPIYNDRHDPSEQERSYDDSLSHDDRKGHENQGSSEWEHFTMMNSGRGYDNNDSRKGHGVSWFPAWKHFTMNDLGRSYEGGFNHDDRKGNANESLPPWKHDTSNP